MAKDRLGYLHSIQKRMGFLIPFVLFMEFRLSESKNKLVLITVGGFLVLSLPIDPPMYRYPIFPYGPPEGLQKSKSDDKEVRLNVDLAAGGT
jgi:hypothetical protein